MKHHHLIVPPAKEIRLKDCAPGFTGGDNAEEEASAKLRKDVDLLAKYQNVPYAQNTYAPLVILQVMNTAGKDGTFRHVMSGRQSAGHASPFLQSAVGGRTQPPDFLDTPTSDPTLIADCGHHYRREVLKIKTV